MHQSGTTFCLIKLQAPLVRKQLLHFVEKMLSYRRPPIGQHAWPVAVLSNGTNNRTHSYPSLRHQNHDSLLYRSRFFFFRLNYRHWNQSIIYLQYIAYHIGFLRWQQHKSSRFPHPKCP